MTFRRILIVLAIGAILTGLASTTFVWAAPGPSPAWLPSFTPTLAVVAPAQIATRVASGTSVPLPTFPPTRETAAPNRSGWLWVIGLALIVGGGVWVLMRFGDKVDVPPPQGPAAPNPPASQEWIETVLPPAGTPLVQADAAAPTDNAPPARLDWENGHSPVGTPLVQAEAAAPTDNAPLARLDEGNVRSPAGASAAAAGSVQQAGNTLSHRLLWRIRPRPASAIDVPPPQGQAAPNPPASQEWIETVLPPAGTPLVQAEAAAPTDNAPPARLDEGNVHSPGGVEAAVPPVDTPAPEPEAVAEKHNGSTPQPVPPEVVEGVVPPVEAPAAEEAAVARERNGSGPWLVPPDGVEDAAPSVDTPAAKAGADARTVNRRGPRRKKKAGSASLEEAIRESFKDLTA